MRLKLAMGTALTWSMTVALPAFAQDIGDTAANGWILGVGEELVGQLDTADDIEWFSVQLNAGETYTFNVEGQATGAGSLGDPMIFIMDEQANELARDDDGGYGLNSSLSFTPEVSGGYAVGVSSFGTESGDYLISLSGTASTAPAPVASDDYDATAGTAGRIDVAGSAGGTLEASGDSDWFALDLQAGQQVVIDLMGEDSGSGTLADPYLSLYDATGNLVGSNDDGGDGFNSQLVYTAPETGTFYIGAGAFGSSTGTYVVSVAANDAAAATATVDQPAAADDYSGGTDTSGTINIGSVIHGNLEEQNDTDWFGINLTQGQPVVLELEGDPTGQGTLPDPYITVFDQYGVEVASNDDGGSGLNSRLEIDAPVSGVYFVEARGFGGSTGTYQLSAHTGAPLVAVQPIQPDVPADDYPADPSTTGELYPGVFIVGDLEASNDTDWFSVTMDQGQTVIFDLEGEPTGQGTLSDPYLTLYDYGGNEIDRNDDGGEGYNSQLTFTAPSAGTYFVEARGFGGGSGTYSIFASELGFTPPPIVNDDYPGDTSTAAWLAATGYNYGVLEAPDDADWFAMSLTGGQTVEISLEGSEAGGGDLGDPLLVIYDAFGNELDRNDDGGEGWNSLLVFTAPSDGTYYVSAEAFGASTGSYTLSSQEIGIAQQGGKGPSDDFAGDTSTFGTLVMNGTAVGTIEQDGDTDWFAMQLAGGQPVQISMEGEPTGAGTLSDPTLAVFDQFGNEVAYNDDGGEGFNSLLTFVPPSSGTYYVSAESFGEATGSYLLTAMPGIPDDYSGDTSTSAIVGIGRPVTGSIENSGDFDWFAVNLAAGQPVTIRLEGSATGGGSLSDPYLELYDGNGNFIDSNDDDGETFNSALEFTPWESGRHFISAGAFSDYTGSYTLSVDAGIAVRDDYSSDTSTQGWLQQNSPIFGELESPGDEDWFLLQLQPGNYFIDLEGQATGQGTLNDPYLTLYSDFGIEIDRNDDGGEGLNSQLQIIVGQPTNYYVGAGAFGQNTGTYVLTVRSGGGGK